MVLGVAKPTKMVKVGWGPDPLATTPKMEVTVNWKIICKNLNIFPLIMAQDLLYYYGMTWMKICSMKSLIFRKILRKRKILI